MFRFADVPLSLSGMTRIPGRKVYLRAPTMEDWPEWAELRARSRAFLTPWEPTWPDDSLGRDHFRRRLRQQVREWRAGEAYGLFVFLNDKRRLVGGINLSNVRRGVAQATSVGYWMGQPFAGQGLMTDALRAILPFVFDELRLHRLEAACLPHNEPSKSVLAKAGFHEEGLARQYLRINGQWADHLLFALLRADYDTILRAAR
jgi:ribosomal-protein-alanine N-acetyltransferase